MKNTLLLLSASLFVGTISTYAQNDSSGIFMTVNDYRANHLAYPINYKTDKERIKDHLLWSSDKVKVKHGGETYMLDKNNLYGYRDGRGQDYRFVGQLAYRILTPEEPIILYKYGEPQRDPQRNTATQYNRYYFSINADNSPISLTRTNLKKSFPDNAKFQQLIDKNFRSDDELTRLDRASKRYLINVLLDQSQKE